MSRDRAIELDADVAKVARFMERNVAADRLHYVACRLPELAALIWSADRCAGIYREPILPPQSDAGESGPALDCVARDSAEATGIQ